MNFLRYFFDYAQVIFALYVLLDTYRLIWWMTREFARLRPFEKELLTQRETRNFSPKMFLMGRSFVIFIFLILQLEWSLDNDSWGMSIGHDAMWFIMGMLVCLVWLVGNWMQRCTWRMLTEFREKDPPCGVPNCPIEKE